MLDQLTERVCEQTWRWYDPEGPAQVKAWLTALGCRCVPAEHGGLTIHGSSGMTVGLLPPTMGDPVATATALAFAVLGPRWPQMIPHYMEEIGRGWARRRRA